MSVNEPDLDVWFSDGSVIEWWPPDDDLDLAFEEFHLDPVNMLELDQDLAILINPLGKEYREECLICLELKIVYKRPCCNVYVCAGCLKSYYTTQVSEAMVKIQCIGSECQKYIDRDEIMFFLSSDLKLKFQKFLIDANRDPHRKTCPGCNHITEVEPIALKDPKNKKYGLRLECAVCFLDWCFLCQAPWHETLSCKDYQRGDRLFKVWTKEQPTGQANAQKCPKCKVYIQRSSGCDHMTCTRCATNFCYQCGEKYRELKFIGNHHSRLSILGCKYRFKPSSPVLRCFIRGSIFGGKLLASPIIGGLALGAGVVVLGVGLIALPFYGSYRLHKLLKKRREEKAMKMMRRSYQEWNVMIDRRAMEARSAYIHTTEASDPKLQDFSFLEDSCDGAAEESQFYQTFSSSTSNNDSEATATTSFEDDIYSLMIDSDLSSYFKMLYGFSPAPSVDDIRADELDTDIPLEDSEVLSTKSEQTQPPLSLTEDEALSNSTESADQAIARADVEKLKSSRKDKLINSSADDKKIDAKPKFPFLLPCDLVTHL